MQAGGAFFVRTLSAVFRRELYAVIQNRFLYGFSVIVLLAGLGPLWMENSEEIGVAAPLILMQAVLYFVSLFCLLIGLSSAHGESEEWMMLLSQPVSRPAIVLGKFFATWATLAVGLLFLVAPSLVAGASAATLGTFWLGSVLVAGTFVSFGLAVGLSCRSRSRGLILGLLVWLFFLVGFDSVALLGVNWSFMRESPLIWVGHLMVNPLSAFRIGVLFLFQEVPEAVAGQGRLVRWWLGHPALWSVLITSFWTAFALIWSGWRLQRQEM